MRSLYVPLVLRLEVADKSPLVSFNECSGIKSPTAGEKTRRRLLSSSMKKRSATASGGHAVSLPPDEDLSPAFESHKGSAHRPGRTAHNFPGRRAYSEVVVESLEAENIPFPISEPSSSTTSTILRSHKSTPETANLEHASYYYGNPLLEKTEGIMHFYKYNDEKVAETAQCRMLCMFAVPAQVTVREIVNFIGGALSTIESIKVVRDATPNQYMLIIKFKDHNDAVLFYEEFNNVNFNELESHRCFLLFVDRIECMSSDEMEICAASSSLAELPTCSVCLERLDDSVLAILCNHTFHASCLEKWADNTCPVCRYIQSPEVVAEQRCSECGQSNDLWICLICGNIGCGRYASQHAQRHWEMTSHTYSLKVGGERVWNYAGDNYVHRLIESDSDGKIVEYDRQGGSDADDKDDKLEGIKLEYTLLLTNQLEDQRKYFEERLADVEKAMSKMEKMAFAQVETLESQLFEQTADIKKLRQQLKDVEAIKITAEKKQAQTSEKLNKTKNELKDEQELNKMLRQDQQVWKNQWEKMKESFDAQRKTYDQQVEDLQAQINDLLMHFDAQTKFAQQVETGNVTQSDVVNGQLGISAAEPAKNTHRRKNNRK